MLTLAIVTTPAAAVLEWIHGRMQLVTEEPDRPIWLGEGAAGAEAPGQAGKHRNVARRPGSGQPEEQRHGATRRGVAALPFAE